MRIKMPLMIQLCIPLLSMAAAAPDPEALALCKKYNSFQGKTPKFLLNKVELADCE